VAVAECGCWEGVNRETLATVLSVEGSAFVREDRGRNFSPLLTGQSVRKRSIVRTTSSSRSSLSLLANSLVQLNPDTSLEIVRLALTKDGNETGNAMLGRFAELRLVSGRIFVSHLWGEAPARLIIVTTQGELVTSSNGLFCMEVEEQKTRVTCASGWVEFRPAGATTAVQVPPGSVGQWPAPASNLSKAEADPAAQEDLQQAIEIEQELRALAMQRRNVLPR
jgi:ferric-dicitrate binding protein FerR (iron transport regulator)